MCVCVCVRERERERERRASYLTIWMAKIGDEGKRYTGVQQRRGARGDGDLNTPLPIGTLKRRNRKIAVCDHTSRRRRDERQDGYSSTTMGLATASRCARP